MALPLLDAIRHEADLLTGSDVVDNLPLGADIPDLDQQPEWFRLTVLLGDFDAAVQDIGVLGWFEQVGPADFRRTIDAFRLVGLPEDADLLVRLDQLISIDQVTADNASHPAGLNFMQRHDVPLDVYVQVGELEAELYPFAGRSLYDALVSWASRWLRSAA